jgi:GTP-binding protein Era
MVAPWGKVSLYDQTVLESIGKEKRTIILLVNKMDAARGNALEETLLSYDAMGMFSELVPISSTEGTNIDEALKTLTAYLPQGPAIFPLDVKIDRPAEFLVAELIREKVFAATFKEVPYKTAVQVKWMHQRENGLIDIRADIVVDSKSHKGIIIGAQGALIKKIGSLARPQIEALLGAHVYLQLIVKIRQGWTKDKMEIQKLTGP